MADYYTPEETTEPWTIPGEFRRGSYGVRKYKNDQGHWEEHPWYSATIVANYLAPIESDKPIWTTWLSVMFSDDEATKMVEREFQQGEPIVIRGYLRKGDYVDKQSGEKKENLKIEWAQLVETTAYAAPARPTQPAPRPVPPTRPAAPAPRPTQPVRPVPARPVQQPARPAVPKPAYDPFDLDL